MKNLISSSILAGICIAFGGIAFLKVGGIVGAILFTFGLLTVVHYKLKLFTGTAGFVYNRRDLFELFIILLGNIIGCMIMGGFVNLALPSLIPTANTILMGRLSNNLLTTSLLGVGCGFIMTTAVEFGRKDKFLPLLFGVPLFIMSGFLHSIADAFYYSVAYNLLTFNVLPIYLMIVLGNFIGCNLYRLIFVKLNYQL